VEVDVDQVETKSVEVKSLTGKWVLDSAGTSVSFTTKAMWVLGVKGTAKVLSGIATVGDDGSLSAEIVVDMSSVSTANKKRDAHLQTADFFETVKYPTMTLNVTGATLRSEGKADVRGDLTVHGQTRPKTFPVEFSASDSSIEVTSEFDLDRREWGISWSKMGAGLVNHVTFKGRFERAPGAEPEGGSAAGAE
jgi:polyisoprenoid-binding protein YceI